MSARPTSLRRRWAAAPGPAGLAAAALAAAAVAAPARAQQAPGDAPADTARAAADSARRGAVGISVHYGTFQPAGRSELYTLLDRALAPGARALRPRVAGAALHVRVAERWNLLFGAEAGGRSVASVSRARPAGAAGDVRQWTDLSLTGVQYLGVEWQALRWRGARPESLDRLRLVLGAGAGRASYRVRQLGEFVDAGRLVAFGDDFRSDGRGAVRFASAGVEVPLRRWVGVQGTVRRQAGSAPMTADYASFDRLDLGGTRLDVGLRFHPGAVTTRR